MRAGRMPRLVEHAMVMRQWKYLVKLPKRCVDGIGDACRVQHLAYFIARRVKLKQLNRIVVLQRIFPTRRKTLPAAANVRSQLGCRPF